MSADLNKLIRDDVARFMRGKEPSGVVLATAPVLDVWSTFFTKTNSGYAMFLKGIVRRHPKLSDGAAIETSQVIWLDRKHRWCRTRSRVYVLDGAEITLDGIVD